MTTAQAKKASKAGQAAPESTAVGITTNGLSAHESHVEGTPPLQQPRDAGKKERQRGPVEEVIAKRMRQLGKKLQRYRGYAAQDPSTLNADQRAAIGALPALGGAYKELEELTREKGPVDEQELIQAAKLREAEEAARTAAGADSAQQIDAFKSKVSAKLGLFIRLHALLHPASPTDHHHLTFGHLTLPVLLQDEVQATDVLRVGRMWQDLKDGGKAAQAVLYGLVAGPQLGDEEDEHVHHLIDLLDRPEPEPSSETVETPTVADTQHEDTPTETNFVSEENLPSAPPSVTYDAADHQIPSFDLDARTVETPDISPSATMSNNASGMLNFLQDDELESGEQEVQQEESEHSFEVVPMLEPHQTSGLQPPVEPPVETEPVRTGTTTPMFAPVANKNWADLDEEEENFNIQSTAPPVDEQVVPATNAEPQAAVVSVQENQLAEEPALSEPTPEVPTSIESSVPAPVAPLLPPAAASGSPTTPRSSQTSGTRNRGQGQGHSRQPSLPKVKVPHKPEIDADGFETVARRTTPVIRGRGRGDFRMGRGGGRGRGGGGGGGAGQNRTNGATQEGPNGTAQQGNGQRQSPKYNNGPRKEGQGQGRQESGPGPNGGGGASGGAPTSKPSIYKTVQPTGPKSAPVTG